MTNTLTVTLSGDQYGPALPIGQVFIDKVNLGTVNVSAVHGLGQFQAFTFTDAAAPWPTTNNVVVTFTNDDYAGSATTDRNLYCGGVGLNGVWAYPATTAMDSTGSSVTIALPQPVAPPAPVPVPTPPTPAPPAPTPPAPTPPAPVAPVAQYPTLLAGYKVRPSWTVAGVDYQVGIPTGTVLIDWQTLSGVGISISGNTVTVAGKASVTLSNVDFSLHGGAQLYLSGCAAATLTLCNFGGTNLAALVTTGIISTDATCGSLTIHECSIDGDGAGDASCIVFWRGTGTLTFTNNHVLHFPSRVIEMVGAGGTVIYQYNLMEGGAYQSGAHLNFLEWDNADGQPTVSYNTILQDVVVPSNGEGFQFYFNTAGTMTSPVCSNNVMIAKPGETGEIDISYFLHGSGSATSNPTTKLAGTPLAENNYFDVSGAYGAFYPGSLVGWTISGNVDMTTGDTLTDATSIAPPAPVYAVATHSYDFTDTAASFWQSEVNPTSWPPAVGSPGYFAKCMHTGWPSNTGTQDPSARFLPANDEIQCYEDTGVVNGPNGCTLTATNVPGVHFPQQPWTSGCISQRIDDAMLHGYFEIVASLPQGAGFWPAFWMLPADNSSPPEIDVFEKFGIANTPPGDDVFHVEVINQYGGTTNVGEFVPVSDTKGFHKYGVLWVTGTLTFYHDDVAVASYPEPANYTKTMFMLANVAVGGCAGTPVAGSSASMVVQRMQSFAIGSWGTSTIPLTEPVA